MEFKLNGAGTSRVVQSSTSNVGSGEVVECYNEGGVTQNTCSVAAGPNNWYDYSGQFVWNGAAGIQEFGFEAISSGSGDPGIGNHLDDIQLRIMPVVELEGESAGSERVATDALPRLLVSGNVEEPFDVLVSVTGGTATIGEDFTTPSGTTDFVVHVPTDIYAGDEIPLGINIISDSLDEDDETIVVTLDESPAAYLRFSTQTCGAAATTLSTYTILDEHVRLSKAARLMAADPDGQAVAGDEIEYTFTVENTGGVELTNVGFSDPLLTLPNSFASLAPGAVETFTATYALNQADIDAGRVENRATVTALAPDGSAVEDLSDDPDNAADVDANGDGEPDDATVVTLESRPEADFVKSAEWQDVNGNELIDVGDEIAYSFAIGNTGNVTLSNLRVEEALEGAVVTGGPLASLAPAGGDESTFTASYTIRAADADAGGISNQATLVATDPQGTEHRFLSRGADGVEGPTVFEIAEQPALSLSKEAAFDPGADGPQAGDQITYTFTVENIGNVTLEDVRVEDARIGLSQMLDPLAPDDAPQSFEAAYALTQDDIDAGMVENQATASAVSLRGTAVAAVSDDPATAAAGDATRVVLDQQGALDLVKEAELEDANGNGYADIGEAIVYRFTVANTGNVRLTEVSVSDDKAAVEGGPIAVLEPGQSDTTTFTARYTLTPADLDRGSFENVATVRGLAPDGTEVTAVSHARDGSGPTVIEFRQVPAVRLEMTAALEGKEAGAAAFAGDIVVYTITVFNEGNVGLGDVVVEGVAAPDPGRPAGRPAIAVADGAIGALPVGEPVTLTVRYPLAQEDLDSGLLLAQARVAGAGPDGTAVADLSDDPGEAADIDLNGDGTPDDPAAVELPHKGALSTVKAGTFEDADGNGAADPGDRLVYTVTVTNEGNVTLSDVEPHDAGPRFNGKPGTGTMSAFTPGPVRLAPQAAQAFTATYTLTEADIANAIGVKNGVTNSATATGVMPDGTEVTSPPSTPAPGAPPGLSLPGASITKVAGLAEIRRGEQVPYTITVASATEEALTGTVIDTMPAGFAYVEGSARIAGASREPRVEGRELFFDGLALTEEEQAITLMLVPSGAAQPGTYVNRARVAAAGGRALSRVASATVEVVADPLFDCGDLIGKVFDDQNRNGYQDAGEPGLAGVRVATVKGLLVTTDPHGRFHVACADLPDGRIGSTFIMKLDPRSLPSGYRLTTENPRTVRLTAGKAARLNFGAAIGRVVRLDLSDAAFVPGTLELRPEWTAQLLALVDLLEAEPSVLRLAYLDARADPRLATRRAASIRRALADLWKTKPGRYRLEIETRIETQQ